MGDKWIDIFVLFCYCLKEFNKKKIKNAKINKPVNKIR